MKEGYERFLQMLCESNTGMLFAIKACLRVGDDLHHHAIRVNQQFNLPGERGNLVASVLSKQEATHWPDALRVHDGSYDRILDRLYVPLPRDVNTTVAVLDAIAPVYELLIDVERNRQNISQLLEIIESTQAAVAGTLHVLDFGCGTGLSLSGSKRGRACSKVSLVGLDDAPRMRKLAGARGLLLVERGAQIRCHGILASYVLHGGINREDLSWLMQILVPGGVFVANWLHGCPETLKAEWRAAVAHDARTTAAERICIPAIYGNKARVTSFLMSAIRQHLPPGAHVLDLMSGTGVVTRQLAREYRVYEPNCASLQARSPSNGMERRRLRRAQRCNSLARTENMDCTWRWALARPRSSYMRTATGAMSRL